MAKVVLLFAHRTSRFVAVRKRLEGAGYDVLHVCSALAAAEAMTSRVVDVACIYVGRRHGTRLLDYVPRDIAAVVLTDLVDPAAYRHFVDKKGVRHLLSPAGDGRFDTRAVLTTVNKLAYGCAFGPHFYIDPTEPIRERSLENSPHRLMKRSSRFLQGKVPNYVIEPVLNALARMGYAVSRRNHIRGEYERILVDFMADDNTVAISVCQKIPGIGKVSDPAEISRFVNLAGADRVCRDVIFNIDTSDFVEVIMLLDRRSFRDIRGASLCVFLHDDGNLATEETTSVELSERLMTQIRRRVSTIDAIETDVAA
jgi:hypothetical protein